MKTAPVTLAISLPVPIEDVPSIQILHILPLAKGHCIPEARTRKVGLKNSSPTPWTRGTALERKMPGKKQEQTPLKLRRHSPIVKEEPLERSGSEVLPGVATVRGEDIPNLPCTTTKMTSKALCLRISDELTSPEEWKNLRR